MGNNDSMGINEKSVDTLILNLSDLSLNISNVLDNISNLINDSSTYFSGEVADAMRNKLASIEMVSPVVKNNLESYKEDFIKIKNNHIGFESSINSSEVEILQEKGGDYSGVV